MRKIITILLLSLLFLVLIYPWDMTITTPGSARKISDFIHTDEIVGDYSLTYVRNYDANLSTYLLTRFFLNRISPNTYRRIGDESSREARLRSELIFEESKDLALLSALNELAMPYEQSSTCYLGGFTDQFRENHVAVDVGDELISLNGVSCDNYAEMVDSYQNQSGSIELVYSDGDVQTVSVDLYQEEKTVVGVVIIRDYTIDLESEFTFESNGLGGPSAGMMMALFFYDSLDGKEKLTDDLVSGSGTIDEYGSVGAIGSVDYKVLAAENAGAKYFFCHPDDYELATQTKTEKNLQIEVVSVRTLNEVINFLN